MFLYDNEEPPCAVSEQACREERIIRSLYRPLADSWLVCDNSGEVLRHLAIGTGDNVEWLLDREGYYAFERIIAPTD